MSISSSCQKRSLVTTVSLPIFLVQDCRPTICVIVLFHTRKGFQKDLKRVVRLLSLDSYRLLRSSELHIRYGIYFALTFGSGIAVEQLQIMAFHVSKTSILSTLDYIEDGRADIYEWSEKRRSKRKGVSGKLYEVKKLFIDKSVSDDRFLDRSSFKPRFTIIFLNSI